jgi:hypothetical protein
MAEQQASPVEALLTEQLNRSTDTIAVISASLAVSTAAIVEAVQAMRSGRIKQAEQILVKAAQQIASAPQPPTAA